MKLKPGRRYIDVMGDEVTFIGYSAQNLPVFDFNGSYYDIPESDIVKELPEVKEVSVQFILWNNGEVTTDGRFLSGCTAIKKWHETFKVKVPVD